MCSFIFLRTNKFITPDQISHANFYSKFRGPDHTSVRREMAQDGWHLTFVHNLLDISGRSLTQPARLEEQGTRLLALFNGEIYNYSELTDAKSDTACILPLYRENGVEMAEKLDGEFAILIYDQQANSSLVITDPFLTKPLYIGRDYTSGDFGVSTCKSSLTSLGFEDVQMAKPNSTYQIEFNSASISINHTFPVTKFDLNQHKDSYKDWFQAFLDAVYKRATHGHFKPSVFLSSGYDSGGICATLNYLKLPYTTFTILSGESEELLEDRKKTNNKSTCTKSFYYKGISAKQRKIIELDILENVENFKYWHEDAPGVVTDLHVDGGAVGGSLLAIKARRHKSFVILSGSGSDEILSDYGFNGIKIYHHSEFGGCFPEDLNGFFPWKKFYGDTQRSYLFKDEFILGRHGLEGRYPFLDKKVVQEFLWLTPALKNKAYKAPLAYLLDEFGYPFEEGIKRGFNPDILSHNPSNLLTRAGMKVRSGVNKAKDVIFG